MQSPVVPKRSFRAVLVLLLLSILVDQCCIAKLAPWSSNLIGINFIPVVLGIPVNLELTLGLFPILVVFAGLYSLWLAAERRKAEVSFSHYRVRIKFWKVLVGILAIPCSMLLGGILYNLVHDYLPKDLRNGIESIGLNADVYVLGRGGEAMHLNGSLVLLGCLFAGIYIFRKKAGAMEPEIDLQPAIQEKALESA